MIPTFMDKLEVCKRVVLTTFFNYGDSIEITIEFHGYSIRRVSYFLQKEVKFDISLISCCYEVTSTRWKNCKDD